jgi:monoamine oxidase
VSPAARPVDSYDVAIAGGGVSGLYAAWRLVEDAKARNAAPPSIVLFEADDHVGGRLLTWLPLGEAGGLRAEMGGMRFFEQQQVLWNLIAALGFGGDQLVPFPVDGPNLRLMLRGVSTPLDTPDPAARYLLSPKESGKTAWDIVVGVAHEVLATPENRAVLEQHLGGKQPQDREQWDAIKPYLTWRGKRLWDVGYWNLLSDVGSPETPAYIGDALGYYTLASNGNAAEAVQAVMLDLAQNPVYKTLSAGCQALPTALAEAVESAGVPIVTGTRLVSFEVRDDGRSALTLAGPDGRRTATADRLILALPRRALELLAPSPQFDLEGDARLKQLVQSVKPTPAFKLFYLYSERWWERLGITQGRSVSDLPIRQTYYFAPDPPPGGGEPSPAGLLMVAYNDARAVDYWQGLVPPDDELALGRSELGDEAPPHLHKAPDGMLAHAKQQLALLHDIPVEEIPDPDRGAFVDWGFDPFGGGWCFWSPRVDVRDAMERIKVPLGKDTRVHIVGDCYSGLQGWVEGALGATEAVLQRHLGLERPQWLPEGCYLGW